MLKNKQYYHIKQKLSITLGLSVIALGAYQLHAMAEHNLYKALPTVDIMTYHDMMENKEGHRNIETLVLTDVEPTDIRDIAASGTNNKAYIEEIVLSPYQDNAYIVKSFANQEELVARFEEMQITTLEALDAFLRTTEYSNYTHVTNYPQTLLDTLKGNCRAFSLLIDTWFDHYSPHTEKEFVVDLSFLDEPGHISVKIINDLGEAQIIDPTTDKFILE